MIMYGQGKVVRILLKEYVMRNSVLGIIQRGKHLIIIG